MFCVKCNAEYRDGIEVCPKCNSHLVNIKPEEKQEHKKHKEEKGVEVYNAADEFEADVIIAKLEAEGIFAYKKYKGIDSYNRIVFGKTLLGVRVIVGESNYEEARIILSDGDL